ncbi:uncharacterized protein HMPREF1541_08743 [Cyphellophora europaea CBS 101466]|uniref:C2H2-type domain-containing protein n=1 Tax=Cyphellophora europaea (strain CBS 101466) TaxID=1220924 RepID=W2RJF9_CYPE1|nr:uncharacterized protein HMPREF1541_08743 [Cyphellophora europaea CBS 101466]ETN36465.1 hypothetical protein HMPREF1541_08743 [Cyphellophora europaea CBS 101466]
MDVRSHPRERLFSILNDNDSPSFVIPQRRSPSPARKSPKQERPTLFRQTEYQRSSSFSSSSSTPPLLRYDSSSSKNSSSSMDSSPSPITPAYNFADPNLLAYDNVMRQDLGAFLPSPSTITPFMENSLMIGPNLSEQYAPKAMLQQPPVQYPILPAPTLADIAQLPTPASTHSAATSVNKTSPVTSGPAPATGKNNKYPCPYAQSHHCSATFTTSGHAARHGKKHTGEKGVHCPVCNKAFTRKDNMKQHERTHKGSNASNSDDAHTRRSKAAIARDVQRNKHVKKQDSDATSLSDPASGSSVKRSPPSETTSLEPLSSNELAIGMGDPTFFSEPNPLLLPQQPIPENMSPPTTIYPPMTDDALMSANNMQPMDVRLPPLPAGNLPMPPLIRGFSDLDTLAQAAESFDPCYQ